jgi:hypothetical protein
MRVMQHVQIAEDMPALCHTYLIAEVKKKYRTLLISVC